MRWSRRLPRVLGAAALAALIGSGCLAPLVPARAAGTGSPARGAAPSVALGAAPVVPPGAVPVGPVAGVTPLGLSVALSPRNPQALAQYAGSVSDPSSPDYRHFLAPAQFADAFGPTPETVAKVRRQLQALGVSPGPASANRLLVPLHADAAAAERAFRVPLERYRLAGHRLAYANRLAPRIPLGLVGLVTGVEGLSDLAPPSHGPLTPPLRPSTTLGPQTAGSDTAGATAAATACPVAAQVTDGGTTAYTADQLARAYSITGLYSAPHPALGQGVTIGVVEYESFDRSDVSQFASCYLPPAEATQASADVSVVPVDGGPSPGPGSGEAALDLEVLLQTAPLAHLEVYEAPSSSGSEVPSYNAIVSDDTASVISTSWSSCEAVRQAYAPGELAQLNSLFEEAAVQGQSVLAAAGDSGAQGCLFQHTLMASDAVGGPGQPIAVAADTAHSTVYVANRSADAAGDVGVLDEGSTTGPYRTIALSGRPTALWVDRLTSVAYVATSANLILPLSHCYVGATPCAAATAVSDLSSQISAPASLAGDPGFSGGQLYVANPGAHDVVVVSEPHRSVLGSLALPASADPALVAVDPLAQVVYVADNTNLSVESFPEPTCQNGICPAADPTEVFSLSAPATGLAVDSSGTVYATSGSIVTSAAGGSVNRSRIEGFNISAISTDWPGVALAVGSSLSSDPQAICPSAYGMVALRFAVAGGAPAIGPCVPAEAASPVALTVDATHQVVFTADSLAPGVEAWDLAPSVQDPASQPEVTAVGGTSLSVSGSGAYTEKAWDDPAVSGDAGGGGPSAVWPLPTWQPRLAQAATCGSSPCREVPDVAASADPYHGYAIYYDGSWGAFGGTSASTPLWAGITALSSSSCPGAPARFGLLGPTLYRLAAADPAAFNDIGSGGGNIDYMGTAGSQPATGAGYDMATGLGSPSATRLAADLCRAAVGSPAAVTWSVDSLRSGAAADWTTQFTTGAQGALVSATSTISLDAPPGTVFPASASSYRIQGAAPPAPPRVSGGQAVLTVPVDIGPLTPVVVDVTGVTNPGEGAYPASAFGAATSADTATGSPAAGMAFSAAGLSGSGASPPAGTVGAPYSGSVAVSGGTPDYRWELTGGQVPPGLALDAKTGLLAGTPTASGSFPLDLRITDSSVPPQVITLAQAVDIEPAPPAGPPGGSSGGPSGGPSGGSGGGSGPVAAPPPPSGSVTPSAPVPPAGALDPQVGISTRPTGTASAASGQASASGEGVGALMVASYGSNPVGPPPPEAAPAGSYLYFDVRAGSNAAFSVVTVSYCGVGIGAALWWFDGTSWRPAAPQSSAGGCAGAQLSSSTSPAVSGLGGTVFAIEAPAAASIGTPVVRVSGADREATAIAASQAEFPSPGSARVAVLARSDTFADALAGAPLAARLGGPLLISSPSFLDPAVAAELARVLAPGGEVYLLGGADALAPAIDQAVGAAGFMTERLAGADRFATAVTIASQLGPLQSVFEATGLAFPDALAAGPAAVASGGAVLLTDGPRQAPATAAFLGLLGPVARYALGGPAAAADPGADPVVGSDRYATAALVALRFFNLPRRVAVATGLDFPDALAAGALLGASGPVLLVDGNGKLPPGVTQYLSSVAGGVTRVEVLGGTAAVGPQAFGAVSAAVGGTPAQ